MDPSPSPRVCLVTGASSGIGRATARELLRAGHTVVGAARRTEHMADLVAAGGHAVHLDLADPVSVEAAVDTVLAEQGRVDVLVNNAGAGLHGAFEDTPVEQAERLFRVNVFGPARLTRLLLPAMRERRSGTIVNVSSIAGEIVVPLAGWYHATKHAVEACSDAWRQELRPFGVDVVVVQPGIVRTGFERGTAEDLRRVSGHGPYRAAAEWMAARAEAGRDVGSRPELVARTVARVVATAAPRSRYAVGHLAVPLLWAHRVLPDRVFDRVVAGAR